MSLFYQFLICFAAALCFSLLLNQPRRSIIFSAVIGAFGYVLFYVLGKGVLAYFVSAFFVGIACEGLARWKKTTATQLITCSLIPLIPGLGLYRTVRYLTENQFSQAMRTGLDAVLGICAIALAITFSTLLFKTRSRS